jgi:hypothetical protein
MQDFHPVTFQTYANNLFSNFNDDPESVMLNGHTTFLMSKPEYRQDIHKHRMQWIVNNYTNYENVDRRPYYQYYKNNITDDYEGTFNPPPCFYNEMIRQQRKQAEDKLKEDETDDIAQHYRELASRSEKLAKLAMFASQCDIDDQTEEPCLEFGEHSISSDDQLDNAYQDSDYDDVCEWDEWYDNECFEEVDYDY